MQAGKLQTRQIEQQLTDYAFPVLGDLLPEDITPTSVVKVLEPIRSKPTTAGRVRLHIKGVIDRAIKSAAGEEMHKCLEAIEVKPDEPPATRIHPGHAVTTEGYKMQIKYCIHAAVSNFRRTRNQVGKDDAWLNLAIAYEPAMMKAKLWGVGTIALPLLGSDEYKGDTDIGLLTSAAISIVAQHRYPGYIL